MRDKEIVGLWEAYLQVHQPKEEVEQLDENVQGAVKGVLEKGANFMKTNPVGKAVGSIIAPVNPGRKTPTATSGGYRKEEVEELDEISKELAGRVVNARIARTGRAFDKEMKDRTPENMRASMKAAAKEEGAKRLAAGVRKRRNATNEEVENWVNSLIDEGYDLSEYTWDDMYEIYMTEGRNTSLSALSAESEKRKADKKRGRPETESEVHGRLALGDFRPGASQEERARGGRQRLKDRGKVPQKGGKDMFEHVLEYLVAEGYADTNESALVIMANMSEEWRESIVEAYQEPKFNRKAYLKKLSKRGGMGMGTPDDPHGYRDPKMAKVGAEFSKRKTAAAKARKTGEPDKYRAEKESQSKMR